MEWLNNILRNLEGLFTDATEYAYANPKVGYLVVIFLLLVWLVGLIFDWTPVLRRDRQPHRIP